MLPCRNGVRSFKPPLSRSAHSAKARHYPCVSFWMPGFARLHCGGNTAQSGADGARRYRDRLVHGHDPNSMRACILPRRSAQCGTVRHGRFRLRPIHRYTPAFHGSASPSAFLLPSPPCFGASSCLRSEAGRAEGGQRRFRYSIEPGNSSILPPAPWHFLRASLRRRACYDMLRA